MIDVEKVTKYYGRYRALDRVSFHVRKGEILGFLGPNGAGKTTTMKILTSFINPTEGTARVAGYDVVDQSLEVRRLVGYLPENAPLYQDMRVLDYLEYVSEIRNIPRTRRRSRMKEVADVCGLHPVIGRPIGDLSKGYRQRVGLAHALIHEPEILILDEPTSGLDPNQIVEIRDLIREIGREKTVILSTHILSEVEATCTRAVIINDGRIVADGALDELRSREDGGRVHVKLAADGVSSEGFRKVLAGITGVRAVTEAAGEPNGVLGFQVEMHKGADVRERIFRLAVEKGWTLLEMRKETLDLEDVFRKLTLAN